MIGYTFVGSGVSFQVPVYHILDAYLSCKIYSEIVVKKLCVKYY